MEGKVYDSVMELIGRTPLVRLHSMEAELGLKAKLFAKVEGLNPAGSVKDRVALSMIMTAREQGRLMDGATIVEPTSGNTGIGLCAVCAMLGYKAVIVMPENMSKERIMTMKAYGATVVLTSASEGMKGAIAKANELLADIPGSSCPDQFSNPSNSLAHELTTGPEIHDALASIGMKANVLVAGIGTGGTITGVGRFLKSKDPSVKVVGVEPSNSPFLTKGVSGRHGLQGIGAGFQPKVLDLSVVDEILTCTEEEAYAMGRLLCRKESLFAGISSGAALAKAVEIARRPESEGLCIVVVLPDNGDRYLSTPLYED